MVDLSTANVATILVLIYALVGGVSVIADGIAFREYLESMTVATAGLAVGRGLASRNRTP